MLTFPKNDSRFSWTTHIKSKMMFYHISQAQINRIFRHPERIEEGIAPNTVASMQTKKRNKSKTSKQTGPDQEEIWIMYKINSKAVNRSPSPDAQVRGQGGQKYTRSRITMISAWRYPGKTKKGERPEIPEGLLDELKMEGLI